MQKFFTTTIISKFIKYLLACTPLPTCSYIDDLEMMVEGRTYLYNKKFYLCTGTGIFDSGKTDYSLKLYCSDTLQLTDNDKFVVTDDFIQMDSRLAATYKEVGSYTLGDSLVGLTEDFASTSSYYDHETHRKLGDYLRLLRSVYNLDLMPLYNCFNNYFVDNIDLSSGNLSGHGNSNYRVTLVPIKFNKEYTISLNSSSSVFIKPVLYKGKLLQYPDSDDEKRGRYIYDNVYPTIYKYGQMKYSAPVKILVENTDKDSQSLERYLYLAIQIPVNTLTRITVIEGSAKLYNYTDVYDVSAHNKLSNSDINKLLRSASSLLSYSDAITKDTVSVPFSDRLIEYLVQHTIDDREELTENIGRVVDKFEYPSGKNILWNIGLRSKLFNRYMRLEDKYDTLNFKDILGYVDKDIEYALDRGYLKYDK